VALAVAGLAEGSSLVRVLVRFRGEARRQNLEVLDHVRSSPDTTVKATLFEDSAAVIGLALAALGLVLRQVTGSPIWDGAASIAIGGLLVAVAVRLGLDSRDFLIGRAADPRELGMIRAEIEQAPGVYLAVRVLSTRPTAGRRTPAFVLDVSGLARAARTKSPCQARRRTPGPISSPGVWSVRDG
jgi:divalent metal cation (Fe/Co/Zn/Cd) transporter